MSDTENIEPATPTGVQGPRGSLTRVALLNAVAAALDYAARVAVGFFINPILVSGLGVQGYGIWRVLGQFSGYLSSGSGRPTQVLKWTVARQQASTDDGDKRRDVGAALAISLLFLPLFLVAGAVLALYVPHWLKVGPELVWVVRAAVLLVLLKTFADTLVSIPRSVLAGANLGYKRMGLSALMVLLGGVLTALAIYTDTGLVGVAAAPVVVALLTGWVFLRVVRTSVPWYGIERPRGPKVKRFLSLSVWFTLWRVVMQAMRASDVVVLGLAGSVEGVTSYSLTKYVPETLVSVVALIVAAVLPGLGGLMGADELKRGRRVRADIMALSWLLAVAATVAVLLWNRSFVTLWVGAEHYAGPLASLAIMVMTLQFVLIRNDANVIDLTLELRSKVVLGLIAGALSIGLAAWFVVRTDGDPVALCVGFVLGRMLLTLTYPWIVGKVFEQSLWQQLRGCLRPSLATLVLVPPAWLYADQVVASGWLQLIVGGGATATLAALLAFVLGLPGKRQRALLKRARYLVERVRD